MEDEINKGGDGDRSFLPIDLSKGGERIDLRPAFIFARICFCTTCKTYCADPIARTEKKP